MKSTKITLFSCQAVQSACAGCVPSIANMQRWSQCYERATYSLRTHSNPSLAGCVSTNLLCAMHSNLTLVQWCQEPSATPVSLGGRRRAGSGVIWDDHVYSPSVQGITTHFGAMQVVLSVLQSMEWSLLKRQEATEDSVVGLINLFVYLFNAAA